jgi:hypothetical protein
MTLTDYLNSKATPATFNTNNAWGFGGAHGMVWAWDDIEVKIGTASTRHSGTTAFVKLTVNGARVFDAYNTAKNRERLLKLLLDNPESPEEAQRI